MELPTTAFGVAIVVAGLLPGVVFTGVRAWIRGFRWSDQTLVARVLTAIVVSVILDAAYLALFGSLLAGIIADPRDAILREPRLFGVIVGVGVGVVPAGLALAIHFRPAWYVPAIRRWPRWIRLPRRPTAFESTPTAWDKVAPSHADRWIKIQYPDGRRAAGWFSGDSFVSTYPQPRDIYIQEQFRIDEDGVIQGRVPHTDGIWLSVTDGCIVEWLDVMGDGGERDGN